MFKWLLIPTSLGLFLGSILAIGIGKLELFEFLAGTCMMVLVALLMVWMCLTSEAEESSLKQENNKPAGTPRTLLR